MTPRGKTPGATTCPLRQRQRHRRRKAAARAQAQARIGDGNSSDGRQRRSPQREGNEDDCSLNLKGKEEDVYSMS